MYYKNVLQYTYILQKLQIIKCKFITFYYVKPTNQHIANKPHITDMGKLVSISIRLFWKNLEIWNFLFLEVLLTRFWVPKMRLIQSHTSPFWDFYYILHSYPSESMELMAKRETLHLLLVGIVHSKISIFQ